MPVIEFEGKTTEEAIETACSHLHLPKDEIKFEIISTGTGGIFGLLTGKKARIRVRVEERISSRPPQTEKIEERRAETSDAAESAADQPKPSVEKPGREAKKEKKPEGRKPRRPDKESSQPDRKEEEPRPPADQANAELTRKK